MVSANLIIQFTPSGSQQLVARTATRIRLDGEGGLVIYGDPEGMVRLALSEVTNLQIRPLFPFPGSKGFGMPCQPDSAPQTGMYTFDLAPNR